MVTGKFSFWNLWGVIDFLVTLRMLLVFKGNDNYTHFFDLMVTLFIMKDR